MKQSPITSLNPLVKPTFEKPCQVFTSPAKKTKAAVRQLAKAEAGKFACWWALGFPPVAFSVYGVNEDGYLTYGDLLGKPEGDSDGEITTCAMAGYAALLGKTVSGKDFCRLRLDAKIKNLSRPDDGVLGDWKSQTDFYQAIYTGIELIGKADRTKDVVTNLRNALPFTAKQYNAVLWTCEAYFLLGSRICAACKEEIKQATELFLKKPSLTIDETQTLYCRWGEEPELDLSLESVEKELGPCPVKGLKRCETDLTYFHAWESDQKE